MSSVGDLVAAFRTLPGVSARSARRFAYYLLQQDRVAARRISSALSQALDLVGFCSLCNALAESDICSVCRSPGRDCTKICVVSSTSDMCSIEQTRVYDGLYFILSGCISPLDGVFPQQVCFDKFLARLSSGDRIVEVILATSFTPEGEATAFFVTQAALNAGAVVSRIARGLPAGSEIEYSDPLAIGQSFLDRVTIYSPSTEEELSSCSSNPL
ncbi:recombination mediator RecR [Candidatus Ichthyocystis hellenicum]|uniref:recombination mediator RecR n=1 Tax=Candidatus Ichthyocystis hellenicum TaxID=1561003 RepID=UPI000B0B20A9|nr:recombination mediator RecR [Candidatus Ichthyocystis hellenicum]